jgi:hypothetical protein
MFHAQTVISQVISRFQSGHPSAFCDWSDAICAPHTAHIYAAGRMVVYPINRIVGVVPTTKEAAMTITEPLKAIHGRSIKDVCALLGVPRTDWHLCRRWAGESLNSKAVDEIRAYVDVMIADRCRKPGDDLLSNLIQNGVDGEELTVDDVRAVVAALVSSVSRRADAKSPDTNEIGAFAFPYLRCGPSSRSET